MQCDIEYPSINLKKFECKHEFCKSCIKKEIKLQKKLHIHKDKWEFKCMFSLFSNCQEIFKGEELMKLIDFCKN